MNERDLVVVRGLSRIPSESVEDVLERMHHEPFTFVGNYLLVTRFQWTKTLLVRLQRVFAFGVSQ